MSSSSSSSSPPPPLELTEMYDNALLGILQHVGNIQDFLQVYFGFLYRKTDFYRLLTGPGDKMGFPPGVAEKMVVKVRPERGFGLGQLQRRGAGQVQVVSGLQRRGGARLRPRGGGQRQAGARGPAEQRRAGVRGGGPPRADPAGGHLPAQDQHGKFHVESGTRQMRGAVSEQVVRGVVEVRPGGRGGDRRGQAEPRALHGQRGRGGARRPGPAHLRLPPEAAGEAAESRDEGSRNAEEGLGRRGVAVQRSAVRPVHVRRPARRRAVLRPRRDVWTASCLSSHLPPNDVPRRRASRRQISL
ncbi:nudC domain-containing protein 3 isoform X2 [Syngnathoides biaculeatus]|uniref:nudC domain-containing protein 3 isoform X2 n=1 Tax=Syngnathoides biaculeatus TaxID=300417 RepID=UPI002ADE92A4|nr:nudC domain-containing protein 3 isoform X2 [Syngnathoides biaculeatus]